MMCNNCKKMSKEFSKMITFQYIWRVADTPHALSSEGWMINDICKEIVKPFFPKTKEAKKLFDEITGKISNWDIDENFFDYPFKDKLRQLLEAIDKEI